jgi:hypothetical protein
MYCPKQSKFLPQTSHPLSYAIPWGELVMPNKKTGSETSKDMASLGSKALRKPETVTRKEIRKLGGAVLGQREGPTVPVKKK